MLIVDDRMALIGSANINDRRCVEYSHSHVPSYDTEILSLLKVMYIIFWKRNKI